MTQAIEIAAQTAYLRGIADAVTVCKGIASYYFSDALEADYRTAADWCATAVAELGVRELEAAEPECIQDPQTIRALFEKDQESIAP